MLYIISWMSIFLTLLLFHQNCFADGKFQDFGDEVPNGYQGRLFQLSQNYPNVIQEEEYPWEKIDFKLQPSAYLYAIRSYLYEGMVEADWRAEDNRIRKWYHVPWMHTGRHARECIRGMTRERDVDAFEIALCHSHCMQSWAIGLYNSPGGYTIGQVWSNPSDPRPECACFPFGTVVAKLLFIEADLTNIFALEGSVEWQANINSSAVDDTSKAIRTLRLLQIDVAVKDERAADCTGWVFGTFVYDKNVEAKNGWERMVPLGLMWGNDPGITLSEIAEGATLEETKICNPVPDFAVKHLGWCGRLNGPVDNPNSSCLSCHSTAQWKPVAPMVPKGSDVQRLPWFRNIPSGTAFSTGQISLDYSLQLMISLVNFYNSQQTSDGQK